MVYTFYCVRYWWYAWKPRFRRIIERMNLLMRHRGPDGNDVWSDESIALGHTRLAIVDVSGSDQPISAQSGNILIANGEIYNHLNLRANHTHYPWTTNGDSETILALHENALATNQGNYRPNSMRNGYPNSMECML